MTELLAKAIAVLGAVEVSPEVRCPHPHEHMHEGEWCDGVLTSARYAYLHTDAWSGKKYYWIVGAAYLARLPRHAERALAADPSDELIDGLDVASWHHSTNAVRVKVAWWNPKERVAYGIDGEPYGRKEDGSYHRYATRAEAEHFAETDDGTRDPSVFRVTVSLETGEEIPA